MPPRQAVASGPPKAFQMWSQNALRSCWWQAGVGSAPLTLQTEHDVRLLDDRENLLYHLPTCSAHLVSGRGGEVVGLWGVDGRDVGGGGCTVEMSRLLGGEVRQEDRVTGTKFCKESLTFSSPDGALRVVGGD